MKKQKTMTAEPIIEEHNCCGVVSVLFTETVVSTFSDFMSRSKLVEVLVAEINTIPSDLIPYGTIIYDEFVFVYRAARDDQDGKLYAEVDLATRMEQVGEIFIPEEFDNSNVSENLDDISVTVH